MLTLNHVDLYLKHPMTYSCPQSTTLHHAQKLIYHCALEDQDFPLEKLSMQMFVIDRGPRGPPLPPPGDFCRHIFLKTMDLELPKSDCLQEIRWCVWLWRAFEDRYPLKNSKIQLWPSKKSILNSTYLQIMPVWIESFPYDLGWHFSTKYS